MKVQVTNRDLLLFKSLNEFGILSTRQIRKLHFLNLDRTTALRRLRKLRQKKYILSFTGINKGEYIWALDKKGADRIGTYFRVKSLNRNVLSHDLISNDIKISLSDIFVGENWKCSHYLRFITNEGRNSNNKDSDSIPDWLCSVQTQSGAFKIAAIEFEQSLKSKLRIKETLMRYQQKEVIQFLWYIFPTHSFGRIYSQEVQKLYPKAHPHWFCYSLEAELLNQPKDAKMYFLDHEVKLKDIIKCN